MKPINYSIQVWQLDQVYGLLGVFTSDMVMLELWVTSYSPMTFRGEL